MTFKPQVPIQGYKNAVFLGSKDFGLNIFKAIFSQTPNLNWVVLHPEDSSDERSSLSEFRKFANEMNLELLIPSSSTETGKILKRIKADIGIVCGWYWLLNEEVLTSIRGGLWGIHNSLLPKYRGSSPLVWSMMNGDKYVGSTIFKISKGLDDGPILHQIRLEIDDNDDISQVLLKIQRRLVDEIPHRWVDLFINKVKLEYQNENEASFCGQRIADDGLIDWEKDAKTIHNFIRAQAPPYPGAFSFLEGEKVEFLKSRLFDGIFHGSPGQILRRDTISIVVSCGNRTAIEILELRMNGTIKVPNQVANSIRLRFSNSVNPINRFID
jgi:methionyl-tRNA formyltransferase